MPKYSIEIAGKTVEIESERPLSDQELRKYATRAVGTEPTRPSPSFIDRGVGLLPAVGGAAGGIIGGIGGAVGGMGVGGLTGAMGGAALGGAAGEALLQLANRLRGAESPSTPLEAARQIGMEGATQGALEAIGGGLTRGAMGVGRALYRSALNPSVAIQRGFDVPALVEQGLTRRILPTGRGLAKAELAREASGVRTAGLIGAAEAKGAPPVSIPAQIGPAFEPSMVRAGERASALGKSAEADIAALEARKKTLERLNPGGVPLTRAQKYKQVAQEAAQKAYTSEAKGAIVNDLDVLADESVAAAYRKAILMNAAKVGETGIEASDAQTQALIGLTKAIENATHQPTRLTNLIGTGVALAHPNPAAAVATKAAYTAIGSKPVIAGAGIAAHASGRALRHAQILRGLNFMRQLQSPPEPEQ